MCVQELLHLGADPNLAGGKHDSTALHAAARQGNTQVCVALVQGGADVSLLNKEGKTATDFAKDGGHTDIGNVLLQVLKRTRIHGRDWTLTSPGI